jgi:hypothetical protein
MKKLAEKDEVNGPKMQSNNPKHTQLTLPEKETSVSTTLV